MPHRVPAFFDRFTEAFRTFSGTEVAALFAAPLVTLDAAGELSQHATIGDIARYFQSHLDNYRACGCNHCAYDRLQVQPLGANAVLATVTWTLLRADGSAVTGWTESYLLRLRGDNVHAIATVDHR